MRSIYETFGTDQDLERGGVIVNYGDGVKFKIARAGGANKLYSTVLEAESRPFRRQMENGTMDNEVGRDLLIEVYAKTVVIGWEGVTDREGKPIPYSKANCAKLLKELPDLFLDIKAAAESLATFRQHLIEDDAKNS